MPDSVDFHLFYFGIPKYLVLQCQCYDANVRVNFMVVTHLQFT